MSIFTASGSTHKNDKIYRNYLQSAQRLHVHASQPCDVGVDVLRALTAKGKSDIDSNHKMDRNFSLTSSWLSPSTWGEEWAAALGILYMGNVAVTRREKLATSVGRTN